MVVFEICLRLVCEFGCGLVVDSFSYVVWIKVICDGVFFLNDGVYGGLFEFVFMCFFKVQVVGFDGILCIGSVIDWVVFGLICDSFDCLRELLLLLLFLEEGDWLLF